MQKITSNAIEGGMFAGWSTQSRRGCWVATGFSC